MSTNHSRRPQPLTWKQPAGAADLAALGREDAELAGERGEHQHRGVDRRERHVEPLGLLRPQLGGDRPDREVAREQGGEEHQLAGEPDDGPDADHARPVVVPVQAGRGYRGCCCGHGVIMSVRLRTCHPDPLGFAVIFFTPAARPCTGRRPCPDGRRGLLRWGRGRALRRRVPGGSRALHLGRVFTAWTLDPVLTVLTVWAAGLYLFGVWVLHDRGVRWPLGRTVSFVVVGLGTLFFATSSGLGTYDTTLLSVHMVQHMVLSMVVPLFLALGAPVTLVLRTLPARPRRWLLGVLHSRVALVLSFAPLTFLLFVISPWALYFTGWYDATLHSTPIHELMHLHLVIVGSPLLLAARRHRPGARTGRLPVPAAADRADAAVPRVPGRDDHGPGDPDRRVLVPRPADGLAARPGRRPARRRRHPLGLRRPGGPGLPRACSSPSGSARRCARRSGRTVGSTGSRRSAARERPVPVEFPA